MVAKSKRAKLFKWFNNHKADIIFVQECIPSHPLNLGDDYIHITECYLQVCRDSCLREWWEKHKKETKLYEL